MNKCWTSLERLKKVTPYPQSVRPCYTMEMAVSSPQLQSLTVWLLTLQPSGFKLGWIKKNKTFAFPTCHFLYVGYCCAYLILRSLRYIACVWSWRPNSCPFFYHCVLEEIPLKASQFTFGGRLVWGNGAVRFLGGYQRLYQMLLMCG